MANWSRDLEPASDSNAHMSVKMPAGLWQLIVKCMAIQWI